MTGQASLKGQRILVVEDDFYLANDTSDALVDAGAEVVGPFPKEDVALQAIDHHFPTAAIVDINLGNGPSFRVARRLQEAKTPFLFLTGYDAIVVPKEFQRHILLQKPVELHILVNRVAALIAGEADRLNS